jgi:1,4-alpha-glucan branching enzyme
MLNNQNSLLNLDPWLKPYEHALILRHQHTLAMQNRIVGQKKLVDFAQGHKYFGIHKNDNFWMIREWLPNATKVFLVGEFNKWQDDPNYQLSKQGDNVWQTELSLSAIKHQDLYKLHIYWPGGDGYRIPAYANRVVQNPQNLAYDAQVWMPPYPYKWKHNFKRDKSQIPYIYEAHIGMSSQDEKVASAKEFTNNVLPRIAKAGYNTIQLMAIQEHPYYGSFGYHVSNLFAPSSRFGTPEEIKNLVDEAHGLGISVILDLVHSHAVKNENEGLSKLDGTLTQYFTAGDHVAWDSRLYDYGKPQVAHFLLSNCLYWLEQFNFDGYRFDGVTSMLYHHHGLEKAFTSYDDYFKAVNQDALAYLTIANKLIHQFNPNALTIAEEMSGMPGLCSDFNNNGLGFDYRLSMGIPDYWIKIIKEQTDEQWQVSRLLSELSNHRPEEKTISYAESHDQALVGDKTLIFRLADSNMYSGMHIDHQDLVIDRAIALHKIIRLLTAGANQGGYLNFMGNEYGHPEWIDFPREGNNWSYKYAKRQWNLTDDPNLKYQWLGLFDQAMISLLNKHTKDMSEPISWTTVNDGDHVLCFMRGNLMFVFNLSPNNSYEHYGIYAPHGQYKVVLSSDDDVFGGYNRIDKNYTYNTDTSERALKLYIPARTGFVLKANKY